MMNRLRAISVAASTGVLGALLVAVPGPAAAAGTTYYVNSGASCSDANAGTSSGAPLCTITAAAKKAQAGDTVQVSAGTYREQVTPVAGNVTYRGSSQAQLLGSATVPAVSWSSAGGTAWTARPGWPASPAQVFAGSTQLSKAPTAAGVATTTNSWFWDSSTSPAALLVNIGADPGSSISGSWTYGFLVRGLSGVTIDGFNVSGQSGAGISLDNGTTGSTVKNTTVSQTTGYGISDSGGTNNRITGVRTSTNTSIGIRILNSTGDLVADSTSDHNGFHGVSVQGGSGNTVRGVTAYSNLRPGTRVATGIDVSSSSSNALVEQNTTYGNDDSGIEIYTGSTGAVVRDNLTYDNNDHGIDISKAPNSTVVSNTVVGNNSSGINVEGGSTGTLVRDNIAVDNTAIPDRSKGDIRVDAASVTGTTINRDLVFQTTATSTPIFEWNGVTYTDFAAFRKATAQEPNGMVKDPGFVSLATRDLRLTGDSPAVDSADSSVAGWSAKDHDGKTPVDDPTVADRGAGTPAFADLGALEFTGAFARPAATSPVSADGLTIGVDATNSGTLGEQASQTSIDCGNGAAPLPGSKGQCAYSGSGSYTVTVRVTGQVVNGTSWTASASIVVAVQRDQAPTAVLAVTPDAVPQGGSVTADATGSGDDRPGATYDIDCGDGSAHTAGSAMTRVCTYQSAGDYTVQLVVTDSAGQTATATQQVTVAAAEPPSARLTLSTYKVRRHHAVTARAGSSIGSATSPITGYRFSCGNGHKTSWSGRATTRCSYAKVRRYTVKVWVRNSFGLVDTATRVVRVRR